MSTTDKSILERVAAPDEGNRRDCGSCREASFVAEISE